MGRQEGRPGGRRRGLPTATRPTSHPSPSPSPLPAPPTSAPTYPTYPTPALPSPPVAGCLGLLDELWVEDVELVALGGGVGWRRGVSGGAGGWVGWHRGRGCVRVCIRACWPHTRRGASRPRPHGHHAPSKHAPSPRPAVHQPPTPARRTLPHLPTCRDLGGGLSPSPPTPHPHPHPHPTHAPTHLHRLGRGVVPIVVGLVVLVPLVACGGGGEDEGTQECEERQAWVRGEDGCQ